MDKIKIAKELLKLAKQISIQEEKVKEVEKIIKNKLESNPIKALNDISEVIDDTSFDKFIKEVKSASIKKAYKEEPIDPKTLEKKIDKWKGFVKKLEKFVAGKPRYVIAGAGALLYSYLQLEMAKITYLPGLFDNYSYGSSINGFLSFLMTVGFLSTVPTCYTVIKNLIQNIFDEQAFLNDRKNEEQ